MHGHGRPRGLSSLPENNSTPVNRQGRLDRRVIVFTLVILSLVVATPPTHGQRIQFENETLQSESILSGAAAVRSSRWRVNRLLNKKQSRTPSARRPLLPLQRLESGRVVDRPRLAEVIKSRNSIHLVEGDWQAMTVERDTAGLFQAYGQLPDRQFTDVTHSKFSDLESLPIAVRQSQSSQQFYFYLANASPWRLRVRLQLAEEATQEIVDQIKSLSRVKFTFDVSQPQQLVVDLAPYDLAGGSAATLGPIESYTFEYLDDVASDMRKRVFALQVKLQQAQQAESIRTLSNPEFLASDSDRSPIQGWEIGKQPQARFRLLEPKQKPLAQDVGANTKPLKSFLQIHSSAGQVTWIRSLPITPTETGRLSISVWLRLPSGTDEIPEVRMAVDGQAPAGDYYRYGVVGRELSDSPASLGRNWKRFAVHFDDLPDELTDLRIGFDVVGDGQVDISQVELYDRWFDKNDAKAITQLLASADAMLRHPAQFDRCRRLLQEHWAVFLDDHFQLAPVPKSALQPVPMFRPKVAQSKASANQNTEHPKADGVKAGESLKR